MPTRSVSSPSSHGSVRRVSDALCRGLKTTLPTLARRRYGAGVPVHCLGGPGTQEPARLRLACDEQPPSDEQVQLEARLRVTHVGGNVYDVDCAVEGGSSRRFTYSLPRRKDMSPLCIPDLDRTIGPFLLGELEQHIGRHRLQHL